MRLSGRFTRSSLMLGIDQRFDHECQIVLHFIFIYVTYFIYLFITFGMKHWQSNMISFELSITSFFLFFFLLLFCIKKPTFLDVYTFRILCVSELLVLCCMFFSQPPAPSTGENCCTFRLITFKIQC